MSYLDFPRLHIAGSFYTDPSTVDNDPKHYDPAVTNPSPWQEPMGRHWFRILDCAVVSAVDQRANPVGSDPILGAPFASVDAQSATLAPAKLVDLDVYQQGVSTVYGLRVQLDVAAGVTITGTVDPTSLNSVWFNAVLPERGWTGDDSYGWESPGGDANASGWFQSVIRVPAASWPAPGTSLLLDQLRAATATIDGQVVLSFRFVVDGYINNVDAPTIPDDGKRLPGINYRRYGRFTAAIGPYGAGDPVQAPGPRMLSARGWDPNQPPAWFVPALNDCPFKVNPTLGTLSIDLANAVSRTLIGGPFVDLGALTATVRVPGVTEVILGQLPYQTCFPDQSGIAMLKVDPGQIEVLQGNPLVLSTSLPNIMGPQLFAESPDGTLVVADRRVLRMTSDPDSAAVTAAVPVLVTRFGLPAANLSLQAYVEPVHGNTPGATVPPDNPGDTPQADGALAAAIGATDAAGRATLSLNVVKDPGSRTSELDGQLYFVFPYVAGTAPWTTAVQPQMVSVLVWSRYAVNRNPTWADIQALMIPYDKLFPFMRSKIALSDQTSFTIFMNNPPWFPVYTNDQNYAVVLDPGPPVIAVSRGAIGWFLTRDVTDPTCMPILRDLSPNKILTILWYVYNHPVNPTPPPNAPGRAA
jgi:hypothetical protein